MSPYYFGPARLSLKRILMALACLITACPIGGCQLGVETLAIEIVTHQSNENVSFEFFVHEKRWWSPKRIRVSKKVGALTVTDAETGSKVWEIEASDVDMDVHEIRYGILPHGFQQRHPKGGKPRRLMAGRKYEVFAAAAGSGNTTFVYQGK